VNFLNTGVTSTNWFLIKHNLLLGHTATLNPDKKQIT
jgi:hypothetical protein